MAFTTLGQEPHFLSTYDSSTMWASSGICKDGACAQEHVPVTTLDGARFHVKHFTSKTADALMVTVVGLTSPGPQQPTFAAVMTLDGARFLVQRHVLDKTPHVLMETEVILSPPQQPTFVTATASQPATSRKEQIVVRVDALSTNAVTTSSVKVIASSRFKPQDLLRNTRVGEFTHFPPEIQAIVGGFEGPTAETIQRIGEEFLKELNRSTYHPYCLQLALFQQQHLGNGVVQLGMKGLKQTTEILKAYFDLCLPIETSAASQPVIVELASQPVIAELASQPVIAEPD